MTNLWITDQRAADDPSLEHYPRMTTWEQVQSTFGLEILYDYGWPLGPQAGEMCWKLVGFNVRTGAAIFFPRVLGMDGTPYWHEPTNTGALVYHTWAGAPEFPVINPLRPDYNPLLEQCIGGGFKSHHAIANWSKQENGYADFAYEHGMLGGPDGGPGVIWVSAVPEEVPPTDGAQYSDCVARLGWIGGTNHLTASPVFQLTRKQGDVPPQSTTKYLANVDATGRVTDHIPFREGPPPAGNAGLVLLEDGKVTHWIAWTPRGV